MTGAGRVLPSGGVLFMYGPYIEPGVETAPSNLSFDLSLKSRNPAWAFGAFWSRCPAQPGAVRAHSEPGTNLSLFFRKL